MNNFPLLVTCEKWLSLPVTDFARDYRQTNLNYLDSKTDYLHHFWQSSIRTITCLLQSCIVNDSSTLGLVNYSTSLVYQQCTNTTMDFVSKFEISLLWCLQGYLFENNISSYRLADMEGLLKNQIIFEYSPASKSLSDNINYNYKELSLGHLILVLRWCCHCEYNTYLYYNTLLS